MSTVTPLLVLSGEELCRLVERVFAPTPTERRLAVLVDLPDSRRPDHSRWSTRRTLAEGWVQALQTGCGGRFEARLFGYPHVGANNADLPEFLWPIDGGQLPPTADGLDPARAMSRDEVLSTYPLVLAPTELSATAPLKLLGRRLGFRGATMPGFRAAMVPALRLDFDEVDRRVQVLAKLLETAEHAELFTTTPRGRHHLRIDLRWRSAHASSGLLRERGMVGNVPSGEAYIVPYEGERAGVPSTTAGELPIQFGEDVALLQIEGNRVVALDGGGSGGDELAALLQREPATTNIAELGLGVLAELGIDPIGATLLDEKLGLHLALGRSDHFGGTVGAAQFSSPDRVVHQDYVYLPATQPLVHVESLDVWVDGQPVAVLRADRYVVAFG